MSVREYFAGQSYAIFLTKKSKHTRIYAICKKSASCAMKRLI